MNTLLFGPKFAMSKTLADESFLISVVLKYFDISTDLQISSLMIQFKVYVNSHQQYENFLTIDLPNERKCNRQKIVLVENTYRYGNVSRQDVKEVFL